jgi:phospholipid/cholesterol/gamma-HCH transport system substrate-binding protein
MNLLTKIKKSKEIKVGFLFIVAISVMIWGLMYLKGLELWKPKRTFYAYYERVNGLVAANPVTIKGLRVGQVKKLRFSDKRPGMILVELVVENDYPIPKNSIAKIFAGTDLLGSKEVEIELGDSKVFLENGDTMQAVTEATLGEEVNQQLLPLKRKAENLISSIDTVATIISQVLNKNTRENLVQAVEHVKEALQNLAHVTYNIDTLVGNQTSHLSAIITNVESISYNLRKNNDKITAILTNFSSISDSLAKARIPETFGRINKTLAELNAAIEKINSGKGTVGLLLNDDKLYNEVTKAAKDLNLLLEDIKANPSKYIKVSVF